MAKDARVPDSRRLDVGLLARRRRRALPPVLPVRLQSAEGDPEARHLRASIGHAISTDLINWRRIDWTRSFAATHRRSTTWPPGPDRSSSTPTAPGSCSTQAAVAQHAVSPNNHRLRNIFRPDHLDQEPRQPGSESRSPMVRKPWTAGHRATMRSVIPGSSPTPTESAGTCS